jgi:hypothetical protein
MNAMTRDEWTMAAVVLSFAALITAHVAIVAGLLYRRPRWRALAAAIVAPLAPFWSFRSGMPVRAAIWIGSALVYVIARFLARK